MVLQHIVDHYLNKILKDYIEDYSSDQFNLKFGIAELNNLKIKLNAINVLELPFKLKHGFIGNLTIKVNFKNIYSTQLSLSIKDVYLILVPNSSSKYNEQLELEKSRAYKNAQLFRIEETLQLMTNDDEIQNLYTNDDSFITKILLQIFNNVQIRIENVHIRIEDDLSNIKTPFAFGLTFSNLVFVTPDLKEKQKFQLKNSSSGIFKIAKLSNFAFYFNCYLKNSYFNYFLSSFNDYELINQNMRNSIATNELDNKKSKLEIIDYILQPNNFHCNVFIHRKPWEDNFKIPTSDIEMNLDKFAFDLNRKQFETILVVVDNLNRLSVAEAYKKWRPELKVKNNAKVWWNFAITCILETDVRRKQRNWSWIHIRDHLAKRKKYKELYKKKLLSDKTRDNLEALLQKHEDEFDVLNLTIVRNQAKMEVKDQLEEKKKKEKKVEEEKNKGWFSGWWPSGGSKNEKVDEDSSGEDQVDQSINKKKSKMNLIEEVRKEFSDESEKEKLYKAISYDENDSLNKEQTYPKGYTAFRLSFLIKSINLIITDKDQQIKISEFLLNEVKLAVSVLPTTNGLDVTLSINSMKMFGLKNQHTPIIEPIKGKKSINMIEVDFTLNPFKEDDKFDVGVKIQAQGLKMVYDKETFDRMIEMSSVTQEISLDELQTIASLKINEFKQRSAISLEHAIETHKKLKLTLNIEPSFILIPETGSIENANNVLLVSLGHFDISSDLPDYNKKEFEEIAIKSVKDRLEFFRNNAYEKYLISISKVQLILSDKQNWKHDIETAHKLELTPIEEKVESKRRHLIHPISVNLILSRCIITDDPDLVLMKFDGKIPDIKLVIEHKQILNLLKLLLSIVKVSELSEQQSEQQQSIKKEIEFNQIKSKTTEEYQSNVIKAVAEQKKSKQILNQIKLQAEFTVKSLLIELKSLENTILKLNMSTLETELKMSDESIIVDLNLESIQFFCCMNYYHFINEIKDDALAQLNKEGGPSTIKELESIYYSTTTATTTDPKQLEKNKLKKELQIAKKQQQQQTEQNMVVMMVMNRVDFIMLDDFELKNNAAVIFNLKVQLMFRQHNQLINLDLNLVKIQMAITEINSYLMNSYVNLFILKPCDLICNVNMEDDNQSISVMMEELSLSISPNMVQILMSMLTKLGSSSAIEDNKEKQKEEKKLMKSDFESSQRLDENSWYIKLSESRKPKDQVDNLEIAMEAFETEIDEELEISSPISRTSIKPDETIKQQLIFQIRTINFIIESGGVSSIPLIRFNSNLLTKFVNYEQLELEMQMFMEYYNEKNFNWEPIFDIIDNKQFEFRIKLNFQSKKQIKNEKQTIIQFESNNRLEITLSNIALNIFKSLAVSFSKAVNQPEILSKEEQKIVIKNTTEMIMFFYIDKTKLKCSDSTSKKELDDKTDLFTLNSFSSITLYPLTKDAIDANSILNYSFIVNEQEFNRSLPLLSNDKSIHLIYSNIYPGTNWKYVIDCTLRDKQTRHINFYSNVIIHNYLKIPVCVYKFDEQNDKPEKVGDINADGKLYLPISLVYSNENQYVYIRPTDNYLLPVNALIWRFDDLERVKLNHKSYKTLLCEPIDREKDQFIYIRLANYLENIRIEGCDENDETSFDNLHHFELYPQFVIRNLLPIDLAYRTNRNQVDAISLKPGEDNHIIDIRTKQSELRLDLANYNGKSWYCFKENFKWPSEDCTMVFEFQSSSLTRDTLLIAANFISTDENGFRLLTIFAPFWMVNDTGLRLKYNLGEDLFITHEPNQHQVCLASFKSKQINQKKKMQLSLENSKFSEPFPVDVVGSKGSILVKMHDNSLCFFTIEISLSEVLFTKIVKISSFYTIASRIGFDIEISEDCIEWIKLDPKTSQSLFPRDTNRAKLYLRLPGHSKPSKGVSLKCTALTLLEVNNVMVCCHVEVTNNSVLIEIVNYYAGSSPALLVNCLEDVYLDYGQLGEPDRYRLPPLSMIHFNWKDPTGFRALLWSTRQSNEIENYLDKDAFGESSTGGIFWVSFYDDNQRVLLVTRNKKSVNQIFKAGDLLEPDLKLTANINGLGISLVNLDSQIMKEICYFSISSSDIVWENRKSGSRVFKGFVGKEIDCLEDAYQRHMMKKQIEEDPNSVNEGRFEEISNNLVVNFEQMRMLKPHKGKLRRICLDGIFVDLSKSEKMINLHLKLNRIQIDNQLDDHIFATILCPITPPKSIRQDLTPKPFIEFSFILQFTDDNRKRFKYLSFLIQEFAVQIDLDFLTSLQSYLEIVSKKTNTNYEELINNSLEFAIKSDVNVETGSSSSKHQFDSIHLSPLKMHLSFSLGTIDTLNLPGILDYLVKSAGVTLIEFKDAVLKINSFMRENTQLTDDEFVNELIEHYKAAALSQFYVIVFGLDLIGNPVGLFLGVKQGFTDLFYEPLTGIIAGPEEFINGVELGVRSFFSSTFGGVAGAAGKITGTLGEGISSLMEQSERKKRRERLNKNAGILQNSKNLAKGIFGGVTGLITKPLEHGRKDGFEGIVKGVGHGMVGLIAQPTTSIIDFTSGTLNQLQRSVNVSAEVKPIRPARAVHADGILTSYNYHEANGREMLKTLSNKSSHFNLDIYVSHCLVGKDKYFMITNRNLLFIKKECMFKSYDVNWHVENSNISQIEAKENVLLIHVKEPKKVLGLFKEKKVFELACENVNIVLWINNKLQSLIKTDWE